MLAPNAVLHCYSCGCDSHPPFLIIDTRHGAKMCPQGDMSISPSFNGAGAALNVKDALGQYFVEFTLHMPRMKLLNNIDQFRPSVSFCIYDLPGQCQR